MYNGGSTPDEHYNYGAFAWANPCSEATENNGKKRKPHRMTSSRRIKIIGSAAALFLAGGLTLGLSSSASAQAAPFLDTPTNHWAYEAVQDLAKKGIVIGYPDGTYGGKRPMTRYEFAVALDRALRTVSDMISANPPAGTPAVSTVTQADLNELQALVEKFRPELDTIQTNLTAAQDNIDALRADVLDTKVLANKAQDTANNSYGVGANRKFQISGYIQARYQAVSAGQGSLARFPQGTAGGAGAYNGNYLSGSSPSTFDVRRARLKFTGQLTDNTRYGLQIDASGAVTTGANANQQVTTREAYVNYTLGNGDATKNLGVTAGLFANPFGYILPVSSASYLSPERPLAFSESGAGIWTNQDYDKGIQLSYNTGQQLLFLPAGLKLTAALVNGSGRTSNDTDGFKDQIYRIGYQSANKIVSVGGSYYYGQINTSGIPATFQPTVGGVIPTIPGTGDQIGTGPQYTGRKKELYGADVQIVTPFGPFLNAEYVGGLYEQRSYFNSAAANGQSTVYAKDNHIDGYYVNAGWTFGQTGAHPLTLVGQYDVLRRGEGPGGNSSYTDENVGYGVLYGLDKATRLRFWYERPDRVAYSGTSQPTRYGLFTGELQVKF